MESDAQEVPLQAAARGLDSRRLLRRLVRLDVTVDAEHAVGVVVRSPAGVTATVRREHWSHPQIEGLLTALAMPTADFDGTR